jgi:hypothetical protein
MPRISFAICEECMTSALLLLIVPVTATWSGPDLPETAPFEAPKYGVATRIPKAWSIAAHEEEDRIFVALIPQQAIDRPGVAACELALAPESLDEYRTRINANAKRNGRPNGKLASNQLVKDARGERLETIWEFHPEAGGFWRELSVRMIAHRQLYTFVLNVEDSAYAKVRPAFEALILATRLSPPNTGADLLSKRENRWAQREYKFALELPAGWEPALAPSAVALLFANAQPHGIWSDNLLVLAHPHRRLDPDELSKELPAQLRKEDPNCEVRSCEVVLQGKAKALETVVRTQRGPFSMTVVERRFRGSRFDYEIKYTVESKRFDQLAPTFRRSFDSFRELPGEVPGAPRKAA